MYSNVMKYKTWDVTVSEGVNPRQKLTLANLQGTLEQMAKITSVQLKNPDIGLNMHKTVSHVCERSYHLYKVMTDNLQIMSYMGT